MNTVPSPTCTFPPERRLELVRNASASGCARHAVEDDLRAHGLKNSDDPAVRDTADAAVLVVSELVTNACRHTHGPCQLRTSWDSSTLVIEVDDNDRSSPTIVPPADRGAEGGFGLGLVEHLADSWGTRSRADGKTVYARITFPVMAPPC
jgi:anti-sigma regulatory factor (Ser/Thr protein kinase)